jgi:hypothetical protein
MQRKGFVDLEWVVYFRRAVLARTAIAMLIRSQNRKTIFRYSHEKRSDACGELRLRLILASVQQIILGHLPENRFVHN